ncbi:MAG: prepilin-type N-terminal cleavage/methylation domain-containing protein [Patescibacteria group bacterium]
MIIVNNKNKGYSLIEIIIYVSIMMVLIGVIAYVINMLLVANSVVKATRRVENSSIAFSDKIVREIRAASDASLVTSYPYDNDELTLTIPTTSGSRTSRFYRVGDRIMVDDNGVQTGPITLSNMQITSLHFKIMSTTTSKAIKYEVVMEGATSTPDVSEKFYGTAVLRGFYD